MPDSSRNCEIVCVMDICKNGKDELTVFTAGKVRRQGLDNFARSSSNSSEGWNNKIRVFKHDLG